VERRRHLTAARRDFVEREPAIAIGSRRLQHDPVLQQADLDVAQQAATRLTEHAFDTGRALRRHDDE
jgi:hypothetical protein